MRQESKAAAALVPTTQEKVQDIEKNEVTDMSSDQHHKDLDYVAEAKFHRQIYSAALLTIGRVGAEWTYWALYVVSFTKSVF